MATNSNEPSFFQRLINVLFGKKDPAAIKRRQLKLIAKNLSKTKYKFYKANSDQVLPSFAKFFYEVYKAISPCQITFNNMQNPNYYKMLVVDSSLTEEQKKILDNLSEESITTLANNMPFEQLKLKVKEYTDKLSADFTKEKIGEIDNLYNKLLTFKQFCTFDFYFLLRKFDSSIIEHNFNGSPNFSPITASYIAEDLKDFLTIAWALPLTEDWTDMMNMFKASKGVEPIKPTQWNKIVSRLKQLKDACAIEMLIQLTTKDPDYSPKLYEKKEQIVETYIEKIRTQAQLTIRKLESAQKNSKIDSIVTQIFNTTAISTMKFYTEKSNDVLQHKNIPGFEFVRPINYMRAFLIEFVKRDVREYADLVLIRGKWVSTQLSQNMSDAFNKLMEASDNLSSFDQKHNDENGAVGSKIKTLLPRAERDKESMNIIKTTVRDSNALAKELLINTTKTLIVFGKSTKALIEDYKKTRPEMLTNWKELDRFAEHPITELSVEVYKKIYLFVQLMQNYMQK